MYTLALSSVLALIACGGGGSSSPGTVTGTPGGQPVPVPTVADALDLLNQYRVAAGINPMVMNAAVTTAAQSHANYLTGTTLTDNLHSEDVALKGFTGVNPADRVQVAGYTTPALVSEVIKPDNILLNTTKNPIVPIRSMMNLPYHGLILLSGYRDFGMGLATSGQTMWSVVDLASPQKNYGFVPQGEVRMWPCGGVTNILNKSDTPESPQPISGRNLESNPIGTPIYVWVNEQGKLTITSYDVRSSGGQVVAMAKVLGQSSSDGLQPNQMALLPDQPLVVNTTYTAAVAGTNNGQAFSKTCTFTTGN
jgi:hypothetical protein